MDSKNIKKSLNCLAKYISNKNIDTNKANNVKDLKGIDTVAWNLILSIYTSGWDFLYADENKNLFKQKVSFIYILKAISIKNSKKGEKSSTKLVSIERLPPSILAKSPKEIKVISKFFKVLNTSQAKKNLEKIYAQASKFISNTEEVLKIKNTFPSL